MRNGRELSAAEMNMTNGGIVIVRYDEAFFVCDENNNYKLLKTYNWTADGMTKAKEYAKKMDVSTDIGKYADYKDKITR